MTRTDKLDPKFKHEVAGELGGENVMRCFSCGTCTAGCPVRAIDGKYNPRKIIHMVILGMRKRVITSDFIWLCSTCYTCYDRCPQGVHLTDIMTAIKNIAVKEGHIHPAFKEQARLIMAHGRLYEIEDFDNKRRGKMGLPPIKKTCAEMEELIENTRVAEVIQ